MKDTDWNFHWTQYGNQGNECHTAQCMGQGSTPHKAVASTGALYALLGQAPRSDLRPVRRTDVCWVPDGTQTGRVLEGVMTQERIDEALALFRKAYAQTGGPTPTEEQGQRLVVNTAYALSENSALIDVSRMLELHRVFSDRGQRGLAAMALQVAEIGASL